jgi:hypothetical protein
MVAVTSSVARFRLVPRTTDAVEEKPMARFDRPTILIQADGRTLATAELHPTGTAGVVHSDMHVESGHLPAGTRSRLVDAVLAHPDVDHADRLVATMPLGDTEMLARVRERCDQVEAHAAGATKVVEARVHRPRAVHQGQ